jgi:hypothetical protein
MIQKAISQYEMFVKYRVGDARRISLP